MRTFIAMEMFEQIPACILMVNLNKSESWRETAKCMESELIREKKLRLGVKPGSRSRGRSRIIQTVSVFLEFIFKFLEFWSQVQTLLTRHVRPIAFWTHFSPKFTWPNLSLSPQGPSPSGTISKVPHLLVNPDAFLEPLSHGPCGASKCGSGLRLRGFKFQFWHWLRFCFLSL